MKVSSAALLVAAVWLLPGASVADTDVTARLAAPAGEITVGDPVPLKLTVTHPPGTVFDTPDTSGLAPQGADASFLVEDVQPVEVKAGAGKLPGETSWFIRIRPFAPGEIRIPPLTLTYHRQGAPAAGTAPSTVTTGALILTVKSVLKSANEEPADIRGPWRLAAGWLRAILWTLAILTAAVVAWLAFRRLRARQLGPAPVEAPAPSTPPEPPYDRAMRDLARLLASGLLGQGKVKEFHVALSEIVKRFLGDTHQFDALDRTTQEVLMDLRRRAAGTDLPQRTAEFLEACDLVKFAKHRPAAPEVDATVAAAKALIETGRPSAGEVAA